MSSALGTRVWRWIGLCCVLGCAAIYGYWGVWLPLHAAGYDFTGPYEAAYALVHHAPLQVYDVPAQRAYSAAVLHLPDGPSDFRWTPPAAVLLMPLALLPYWTARVIWWALSQAALVGALWLLARCAAAMMGGFSRHPVRCARHEIRPARIGTLWRREEARSGQGDRQGTPLAFLALCCAAAIAQPVTDSLRLGQSTTLLLLGFALIAYGEVFDRQTLSGIGLGVAILDKLFPGALLVFFLWRGRYRLCVVAVGLVALLGLVTLPVTGVGMYGAFAQALRTYSNTPNAGPVNLSPYHGLIVGLSALLRPGQAEPTAGALPALAALLCAGLFGAMVLGQGWPVALRGWARGGGGWARRAGWARGGGGDSGGTEREGAGEDADDTRGSGGTGRGPLLGVSWAVCSLLVVEPIDWIFYYLLLLVPLAWLLTRPGRAGADGVRTPGARGWWLAGMLAYFVATLPLPLDSRTAAPMSPVFVVGICVRPAALLVLWAAHAAFAYGAGRGDPVDGGDIVTAAPAGAQEVSL